MKASTALLMISLCTGATSLANQSNLHPFHQDRDCAIVALKASEAEKRQSYVQCLNRFAQSLLAPQAEGLANPRFADLEKSLELEGLPSADVSQIQNRYQLIIEESNPVCLPLSAGLLKNPKNLRKLDRKLQNQLRASAEFIFYFHRMTADQKLNLYPVRTVSLCQYKAIGREMVYHNGKLTLGLDQQFSLISFNQILDQWDNRKAFSNPNKLVRFQKFVNQNLAPKFLSQMMVPASVEEEITRDTLWKYFNPTSETRKQIRTVLSQNVKPLIDQLKEKLARKEKQEMLGSLKTYLKDPALSKISMVDPSLIRELEGQSEEQLARILGQWLSRLQDPAFGETLFHTAVSSQSLDTDSQIKVKRVMKGLVNVSNWHVVLASLEINLQADSNPLIQQLIQAKRDTKVQNSKLQIDHSYEGIGLVNVDTVDFVKAFVRISGEAQSLANDSQILAALLQSLQDSNMI